MLGPVLTLLLSFSAGSLIIVSLKVQEFLLKTQNASFVVQKKISICLSVLHQFCRSLRVIKSFFQKLTLIKTLVIQNSLKEKNLSQIIIWNANFPPMLMVWRNTECCENWNSWMFRWFFSRRLSIFLRGSFNKFGEWKVFRCLLVFFCFVFHNVGAKSSTQNGNFFTWVLPIAFKFKMMFVHLLRELEKA